MKKQQYISTFQKCLSKYLLERGLSYFIIYLFAIPTFGFAQHTFSQDSIYSVPAREFNQQKLDSFRNHPDFVYNDDWSPPDPTWFERLIINLIRFLDKDRGGGFTFGRLLFYLIAIIAIFIIIWGIYKLGFKQVFSRKSQAVHDFGEFEGNIEEIDFEALIKEARENKTYKLGVRLLYLETLKILTQNNYITWEPYKVNQQYLWELKGSRFYEDFDSLTQNYEYVCYGDFYIDLEGFNQVEEIFRRFQRKIGSIA